VLNGAPPTPSRDCGERAGSSRQRVVRCLVMLFKGWESMGCNVTANELNTVSNGAKFSGVSIGRVTSLLITRFSQAI